MFSAATGRKRLARLGSSPREYRATRAPFSPTGIISVSTFQPSRRSSSIREAKRMMPNCPRASSWVMLRPDWRCSSTASLWDFHASRFRAVTMPTAPSPCGNSRGQATDAKVFDWDYSSIGVLRRDGTGKARVGLLSLGLLKNLRRPDWTRPRRRTPYAGSGGLGSGTWDAHAESISR